jgi:hypothetical protein
MIKQARMILLVAAAGISVGTVSEVFVPGPRAPDEKPRAFTDKARGESPPAELPGAPDRILLLASEPEAPPAAPPAPVFTVSAAPPANLDPFPDRQRIAVAPEEEAAPAPSDFVRHLQPSPFQRPFGGTSAGGGPGGGSAGGGRGMRGGRRGRGGRR